MAQKWEYAIVNAGFRPRQDRVGPIVKTRKQGRLTWAGLSPGSSGVPLSTPGENVLKSSVWNVPGTSVGMLSAFSVSSSVKASFSVPRRVWAGRAGHESG